MAPKQYRTPPQAPPLFTATKDSLLDDAKKICQGTRGLLDKVSFISPSEAHGYLAVG
jgi:metallopeptidase MepB